MADVSQQKMTAGLFNEDNEVDLAVVNSVDNTLAILLGGGIFSAAKNLPVPLTASLQFIAINDINFDGRPDVITSLSSGNIAVLLGLGDGTFAPEADSPVGGNPVNLASADFNDDTFTDVIAYQISRGTLAFLPGAEVPLPNISVQASDLDGSVVGQVIYLNGAGNLITGASQTDASGRFLILNVPPGIKNIHATMGGSGNRWMSSYPGGATFGNIPVAPPDFRQITYAGRTIDAVGDQALRFVQGVTLSFLGMGTTSVSDPVNSTFNVNVNANSALLIKLQR